MAQMVMMSLLIAGSAALVLIVILLLKPWNILSPKTVVGQKNRYYIKKTYSRFAVGIYKLLSRFFVTHVFVVNLASMFKHMYVLDDDESRVKATSLIIWEIIIGIATFTLSIRYFDDTLLALIMTYMIIAYAFQKLRGDGQRFLEELEETISDMVHMYNAGGKNIDRMFTRILEDRHSYMYRYMEQMYTYLRRAILDTSDQKAITEYNNIVASRHLRLIFNYLYITYRYGDEINITGEQLFNRNMLAIQREVHADLTKIVRIKDETIGEQWFIIMAVAMIPAATWYMNTFFTFDGFETIGRFLNSSFGYTIKVVCAVFSLICYYIYLKLMSSNVALEFHREISWEENILNKHRKLRDFIDFLAPKGGTKRRKKLESDISMSEGYIGVRPLYLKKLSLSLIVTVIVAMLLSVDTYTSYQGITSDLYRGVNKELMDTIVSLEDYPEEYKSQSLSNDMIVIDILKQNQDEYFSISTTDERIGYIETVIKENNVDYGIYYEIAAQRICEKFVLLGRIDPGLILLILIAAFLGAYMLPNLAMKLNLMLNKGAIIYDEVNGCYTVVVLLINHSASNVYMLLNWLTSFASVFKSRLQACVDNLSEHEIKELEVGVEYKPFSRLIECMLLAYEGADLKSAFAGIEQRHLFQEESRRMVNEQIIAKRVGYSEALSWSAMGATFCLYIVAPMILSIVEMLLQLL